jgi:hypothetical protein
MKKIFITINVFIFISCANNKLIDAPINLQSYSVTPATIHTGETAVVEITGQFPEYTNFTSLGSNIFSNGYKKRFNVTFSNSSAGLNNINVTAKKDSIVSNIVVPVTVSAEIPRMVIDSVVSAGGNNYTFSGHVDNLVGPTGYKIVDCAHADIFYCGNAPSGGLNSASQFSFTNSHNANNEDRTSLMLVQNSYVTAGTTSGIYDTKTSFLIPYALNGTTVVDFSNHDFLTSVSADNLQIKNLKSRFSKVTSVGLVRSYLDAEQFATYDQALAVIALTHAGEQISAAKILTQMASLQLTDGSWYFIYNANGTSPYPAGGDRRPNGAIAWMAMALNTYRIKFNVNTYDVMHKKTLDYLISQQVQVRVPPVTSRPIRFAPVDYSGTPQNDNDIVALEHNVDAYSAFVYAPIDFPNYYKYSEAAITIRQFIDSMWNPNKNYFYPGIKVSNMELNAGEVYLDTQSWTILGAGTKNLLGYIDYTAGLKFNCENFLETAGYQNYKTAGLTGFFDTKLTSAPPTYKFVWTEGTLGMILASNYAQAKDGYDLNCTGIHAADFLKSVDSMVDVKGGIPYASESENTDFLASSSIAGTAWYYFVKNNFNPFKPVF